MPKMAESTISKEQVLHIAKLCNLTLSEEEITRLSALLTETLDYINVLDELDTSDIPETFQVTGLTNIFMQADEAPTTLSKEATLSNAKEVIKGMFATQAVFER